MKLPLAILSTVLVLAVAMGWQITWTQTYYGAVFAVWMGTNAQLYCTDCYPTWQSCSAVRGGTTVNGLGCVEWAVTLGLIFIGTLGAAYIGV